LLDAGFAHVECINPPGLSLEEAIQPSVAQQNIKTTVQRLLK
jgi:glycerate kinase